MVHSTPGKKTKQTNPKTVFCGLKVMVASFSLNINYFVLKFPAFSVLGSERHQEGVAGLVWCEECVPLQGPETS